MTTQIFESKIEIINHELATSALMPLYNAFMAGRKSGLVRKFATLASPDASLMDDLTISVHMFEHRSGRMAIGITLQAGEWFAPNLSVKRAIEILKTFIFMYS